MNSTATSRFFPENGSLVSRFREAGDLTLDLLHRDGRVDDRWLGLEPQEFDCLWSLATDSDVSSAQPIAAMRSKALSYTKDAHCAAIDLGGLRDKLEPLGLGSLVARLSLGTGKTELSRRSDSFGRD